MDKLEIIRKLFPSLIKQYETIGRIKEYICASDFDDEIESNMGVEFIAFDRRPCNKWVKYNNVYTKIYLAIILQLAKKEVIDIAISEKVKKMQLPNYIQMRFIDDYILYDNVFEELFTSLLKNYKYHNEIEELDITDIFDELSLIEKPVYGMYEDTVDDSIEYYETLEEKFQEFVSSKVTSASMKENISGSIIDIERLKDVYDDKTELKCIIGRMYNSYISKVYNAIEGNSVYTVYTERELQFLKCIDTLRFCVHGDEMGVLTKKNEILEFSYWMSYIVIYNNNRFVEYCEKKRFEWLNLTIFFSIPLLDILCSEYDF